MAADPIPDSLLSLTELLLEAQLKVVRRVRRHPAASEEEGAAAKGKRRGAPRSGRSQLDVVFAILRETRQPLHITEIISRAKAAGFALDRESIVSALTKRILREDRFMRTAPNTFALRPRISR
jgi:hypothetical protein